MRQSQSGASRVRRGGFTLVEILTAMALAVIVMVGVAQVFRMSSEAVTEAESMSSAFQLARGAMGQIQRDLSRFTWPEGYLCVVPGYVKVNQKLSSSGGTAYYGFDTLMFTAVGSFPDVETNTGGAGAPKISGGGEVVYTYAWKSKTGMAPRPFEVLNNGDEDPRTMMLVRRVYPTSPLPNWSGYSTALEVGTSPSSARSALSLMMCDRWASTSKSLYRLTIPRVSDDGRDVPMMPKVDYVPDTPPPDYFPQYDTSVNMVVCERISEFLVQVWDETSTGGQWIPSLEKSSGESDDQIRLRSYPESKRENYLWAGASVNPKLSACPMLPPMIRVTMVVHPHNDVTPLSQEPYTGDIPNGSPKKYRGMVFRQVFRLNGRGDANLDTSEHIRH